MGLFGSLKGDSPAFVGDEESSEQVHRREEKRRWFGRSSPGQPEGHPQSHASLNPTFSAPPNPPPEYLPESMQPHSKSMTQGHDHPSNMAENPPPYHDWTSIPDTALLPPPPALHQKTSMNNASMEDADRAHAWCDKTPLYTPSRPPTPIYQQVQNGDIALQRPAEFRGDLKQIRKGHWRAKTKASCPDTILLSLLPLYFATVDSPLWTGKSRHTYFELKVLGMESTPARPCGMAIGFCASPYPSWRLPGWERGSLGIHGDDGRRFVNDTDGGIEFTRPFEVGDVVGIGINIHAVRGQVGSSDKTQASVFFTRNGSRDGGWELNEERDKELGSTFGLDGVLDLYSGIGVFGATEFEVRFDPETWSYNPY